MNIWYAKRRVLVFIGALVVLLSAGPALAAGPQIKILLVPGHDNETVGAQYRFTTEASMNLDLATRLYDILRKDKRFEVHITRDQEGYTKEFADYFAQNEEAIIDWENKAKEEFNKKIDQGTLTLRSAVPHHTVADDVALKLYGINKWANENKMDAVIHIHFNDYPRPDAWTIGTYTGFVIYFPDGQMENFLPSSQLAGRIYIELEKKYHTSTYPPELGGLIADQKLIAMGSYGTLAPSVRTVLVEYGYIYEKMFRKSSTREAAIKTMAELTATGIQKYFPKQ